MLIDIKMKKKSIAELGHNGRLKIYVDPKKITRTQALKSISPKWPNNDKDQDKLCFLLPVWFRLHTHIRT